MSFPMKGLGHRSVAEKWVIGVGPVAVRRAEIVARYSGRSGSRRVVGTPPLASHLPDASAAEVHREEAVLAHLEDGAVVGGGQGGEGAGALDGAGDLEGVGADPEDGAEGQEAALEIGHD